MNLRQAIIVFLCCCGVALQSPLVSASSALELLGGFDRQRVQACYPVDDAGSAAEMAKLLYRLRGTNEEQLQKRVTRSTDSSVAGTPVPGDVVQVDGSIDAIKQYPLPEDLREYLEMPAFQEVVLSTEAGFKVSVFAPPLAGQIAKGDRISATAILVARADESIAYAAGRLAWYPKQPTREGWKLLAGVDFDLSLIAGAASRNRRVLEADDHDAFYGLLNASAKVQADSTFAGQNATDVDPVALLTKPAEFYGEWIEMDASTVRISQIAIDSAEIAQQLGQDHYFQIDASGDLGKKSCSCNVPKARLVRRFR
ncbi:hypothetical protein [Rhodopirellula sp. MGV]|uniref:hypothetical protein n=1 Tax=Rhodopirellula sp. MGV TaxID=2023130 RepID=UPI000B963185|nr:hypothetical protein [Rhodopirellula sp. MGV]OYP34022.1 hypothetical protein CGZ80_16545 [Rhodopirellula sp. MGV]PNY38350.1 hypothetical protein C2E31_03305 [Rhodopirellula baltica]